MEFKAIFAKLVDRYLVGRTSLRVKFNANGQVIIVEVMDNVHWVYDAAMTKEFASFSTKRMGNSKEMQLILEK